MADSSFSEHVFDNLLSGLVTAEMLDDEPPSVRVTWIARDSGFRGSGLQVGDRVTAVDGVVIPRPKDMPDKQRAVRDLPGGLNEQNVFAAKGLKDGSPLALTVRRRRYPGEGWISLDIKGRVLAERAFSSAQGRRGMGATGPEELGKDGFDDAWSSWYEKRVFEWSRVLDGGWFRTRLNTRMVLKAHLEEKARVDFLRAHYPGPFADTVSADWQAVFTSLAGTRYDLAPGALDYRELEDERVKQISAAANASWQKYVADHAADIIPAFPSVDPFREDRSHLVGKLVVLPPIGPRDWLVSIDVNYLSSHQDGYWYFAAAASLPMRRVFDAMYRYARFVSPNIRETIAVIGRILPDPLMLAANGRTAAGLQIEPVAALMDEAMFVDLGVDQNGESPFAGEIELKKQVSALPRESAAPREVMEALVAALKAGDQETWKELFADWLNVPGEGRPLYYAYYPYPPGSLAEDWIASRRLILEAVFDARVIWVSDQTLALRGDEFPGAPRIDEVSIELEHVGLFDGEYRAFNELRIHRIWTLQRRNGGPWRIASRQGI